MNLGAGAIQRITEIFPKFLHRLKYSSSHRLWQEVAEVTSLTEAGLISLSSPPRLHPSSGLATSQGLPSSARSPRLTLTPALQLWKSKV